MANPANVALYAHRSQLWVRNTSMGSEIVADRIQTVDPSFNVRTDPYYELGRKGKIGSTQHPPEYRTVVEQNMVNSLEMEFLLAGKNPNPSGAQSYNLGDIVGQANNIRLNLLNRNQSDTILNELEVDGNALSEISYRFTVGGAIMQTFTFVGRTGKLYQSGSTVHTSWGALDDTSLGGIHGKEARIWFTSGSVATTRLYRCQNFTVRCAFPTAYVRELGNRDLAGTIADAPDVTCDFDILTADDQPTEKFWQASAGAYIYNTPTAEFNAFIRVFDPRDTEALTTLKMFKLENILVPTHTPIRAQVRGLATTRYSLTVSKETTTDSGGVIVSNRGDLT